MRSGLNRGRFATRSIATALSLTATLFAALTLVRSPALGQNWSDTGWTRTSHSAIWTGGSPGAAGTFYDTPYAYAYQGQCDAAASADGTYEKTIVWNPGASGWLILAWRIVGVLAFYPEPPPCTPLFSSTAIISDEGPPNYNTRGSSASQSSGTVYIQAFVSAEVENYGNASGEISAVASTEPPDPDV